MDKVKMIIFGCSNRAKEVEKICEHISEIEIIGYVDNNSEKWGKTYFGRPILSLHSFLKKCSEDKSVVVLAIVLEYDALLQQLESLKIQNKYYYSFYALLEDYKLFDKYREYIIKNESSYEIGAEILLIANDGLPRKGKLYRSGFVFRRLKAYRQSGVNVDALGFVGGQLIEFYNYEDEYIVEGRENALVYLLKRNRYKKILVHFMFPEIMRIINTYAEGTQVICWVHGYEIQSWRRRIFNYSEKNIEEKGAQRDTMFRIKQSFWRNIFSQSNIRFVFVSEWLKDIANQDIGMLPKQYDIIPNYIDGQLYEYEEKKEDDVYKILAIKSNESRVYANDIIANTVLLLSKRTVFNDLIFEIYGDGRLFEQNYERLISLNYSNVHIHRKFLSQSEIANLHKESGIFLCPTRQDTQGVSMCEAMSSGMVVVTTNVAAIPEYINEECGVLCDYENAEQMAEAIENLTRNKARFVELSRNASEYMRNRCGYQETIKREIELI